MFFNKDIHDEMKNEFDQFTCPLCDQELMGVDNETKNVDLCCF